MAEAASSRRVARTILALLAWTMLAVVGASFLAALASILSWWPRGLDITPLLQRLRATGPAWVNMLAVGLWGAAVWHAAIDESLSRGNRVLLLGTLVVGNVLAAFVYYFLWARSPAHWRGGPDAGIYRARPIH